MSIPSTSSLSPELQTVLDSVPEEALTLQEEVAYFADDVNLGGFISRPAETEGRRPGVLIISDWSGLNDHTRVRAHMLSRLGFVALAGDIYGGGIHLPPEKAGAEAGKYYSDPDLFRQRIEANLDHLRAQPGVDPDRIAVMGYCFGGSAALEAARGGADIAGVVSFHGRLDTLAPASNGDVKARVLVLTGAADPYATDDDVVRFEDEMRDAAVADWSVVTYSHAMHAFAMPDAHSPEHGATFDARANTRSWHAMLAFFTEIFA